jgi:aryl-alcohol dehydrogenase-like predicted oxidoreductase
LLLLQFNSTPDALALACVIKQPVQPMVLSGAATVQQLQQNFAALELAEKLPEDVLQRLQEALKQPAQQYWDERAKLMWN